MTDNELDAKVATDVMGFGVMLDMRGHWYVNPALAIKIAQYDWNPTTSLEQAHEVAVTLINRMGPIPFMYRLADAVGCGDDYDAAFTVSRAWQIFNASPRQICEAALLAIKKEEEVK